MMMSTKKKLGPSGKKYIFHLDWWYKRYTLVKLIVYILYRGDE
jgi:hypothetical protein